MLVGEHPPRFFHPNIIITGFVEDLPEYIAAADIAVVPLLGGGGTKIKVLEYMACGKAVISTQRGAEGLYLQNGNDILITNYPDLEFMKLIFDLIENPDLTKKIGENARKKIELFYDWEKNSKRAVEIYSDLVRMPHMK